jgi:aspartyl-tRNA(Asn)/glutamyl-tRNA(Gln) amidotransferase subunit C
MTIDDQMVHYLAALSKLHFLPEDMAGIKHDLGKMTAFIAKLNELDTTGVEPLRHIQVWQPDGEHTALAPAMYPKEPTGMLDNATALREASASHAPFFTVPKVLNKS